MDRVCARQTWPDLLMDRSHALERRGGEGDGSQGKTRGVFGLPLGGG